MHLIGTLIQAQLHFCVEILKMSFWIGLVYLVGSGIYTIATTPEDKDDIWPEP